jgi:opacity protein-like surface antigen
MKTYLIASVIILVFSFPSFSAAASGRPGPYFSGFLGTSIFKDTTASNYDYQYGSSFSEKIELNPGIYAGATGGYDFGFVRIEGEFSFRDAEIDTITSQTNSYFIHNVDGNVGAFSSMINVFFDLHNRSRFTPYLGGGIGFATLYLSDTYGYVTKRNSTYYQPLYWESDDTVFAYQLGGGVDIALNNRFSLDVGYRYFKTDEAHLDSYYATSSGLRFESHNAMVGFRMKF